MLFTSERTSPCRARFWRSSLGRSTSSVPSSWRMVIGSGTLRDSVPWGPFTVTVPGASVTSTPLGTGMGERPTRDISASPHVAEDFAADLALARFPVGHQPLAGREHGDTETTEDAGKLVGTAVHPQAGLRDPLDPGDRARPLGRVLHANGQRLARLPRRVGHGESVDVALALEDAGEGLLQLRGRHLDLVVVRDVAVADAGEH